jgi:hypothetical protein
MNLLFHVTKKNIKIRMKRIMQADRYLYHCSILLRVLPGCQFIILPLGRYDYEYNNIDNL